MVDINVLLKHLDRADSQIKMIKKLLREPVEGEIIKKPEKPFVPPTQEVVNAVCKQKGWRVDGGKFCRWYDAAGWKDREGKQIKNWFILAYQWHLREIAKDANNNSGIGNTLEEAMR